MKLVVRLKVQGELFDEVCNTLYVLLFQCIQSTSIQTDQLIVGDLIIILNERDMHL